MDQHCLGALLLENPLMREEDLERCLDIQLLTGGMRPLGEILVEEGILSAEALDELLALQAARRGATVREPVQEVNDLDRFLLAAAAASANELLISEGQVVMVRIAGQLQRFSSEALGRQEILRLLEDYAGEDATTALQHRGSVCRDFAIAGIGRGRVEAFWHFGGLSLVVRLHAEEPRDLADLELPGQSMTAALREALRGSKGLVLVTGEVRSGITETLGAMLHEVCKTGDRLVTVLDDSLEFAAPDDGALVVQRRIGDHTPDYRRGLRSAIAHDADVLVVGDASHPDVFDLCLRAAEAGTLVVAAVRTRTVVSALQRVLSFYHPRELQRARANLAATLCCVLAVQLLPDSSHTSQVVATEFLAVHDAVREVVRDGMLDQLGLLMRMEGSGCGHSMDDSLLALLRSDRVRVEDAFARAHDRTHILNVVRREG